MKPAPEGASATLHVTVTPNDVPAFANGAVHQVYSTAAMVRDMEHAARLVLLPLLEPGEEGVGAEVWCRHEAPVPIGSRVEIVATAVEQTPRRLVCRVVVHNRGQVVGHGTVTQVIIDPSGTRYRRDRDAP